VSDHKHDWLIQIFVFPDEDPTAFYEHDEAYEVLYCSDRECGQRTTRTLDTDKLLEVRSFNALPNEEVRGGESQ